MRRFLGFMIVLAVAAGVGGGLTTADKSANPASSLPQYTAEGQLIRPTGHRTWVFVGASIGMSYSEEVNREGPGNFHNVYIQPEAYRQYTETGKFPEKTMLVMEDFQPASNESINKHGYFEGELVGLEVALKDRQRFEEGWAYFSFSGPGKSLKKTAEAFPRDRCYACHAQHGGDDNVFVQFYPILRGVKAQPDK